MSGMMAKIVTPVAAMALVTLVTVSGSAHGSTKPV